VRAAVLSWGVVLTIGAAGLGPMAGVQTVTAASAAEVSPAQAMFGPPAPTGVTIEPVPPADSATTGSATAVMTAAMMQATTFTSDLPDGRARIAIATAMAQIGLPYVWGGNGPTNGDAGFDCSGLTTFAYAAAGVALPRTAHTQYYAGPHVPAGAPLQPGDLVFYGTPAFVHHVGMYIGAGLMVNAPTFGKPVQTAYYRWTGDDYLGATRPATTGSGTAGLLLAVPPAPAQPATPHTTVFAAPPAPLPATPLPDPAAPQPSEADTAAAARAATDPTPVTPTTEPAAPLTTSPLPTTSAAATSTGATTAPTTTRPVPTTEPAPVAVAPPTTTTDPIPTTTPPAPTTTTTPPAPTPAAASTTPPKPKPVPTTVTVAGATVPVVAVRAGADGLPSAIGLWSRAGRPVLRLSAAAEPAVGSTVTITRPGAAAASYVVRYSVTATTADAAAAVAGAPAGTLIVVIANGPGSWTVLTAV
jgi:cell wall-associated NlpC family hydrolase